MTTHNEAEWAPPSKARIRRAEGLIALARSIVLWERVWPALWPGMGVLGLYAALALSGVLEMLPSAARVLLLGAVATGTFVLYWKSFGPLRRSDWQDGARRLERDSGLANRPLTEGKDRLAAGRGDAVAEGLWRIHVVRLLASAKRLCLKFPSPKMRDRDRHGLRFAVLAALVAAFFYAGPNASERLLSALMPPLADPEDEVLFNAWVSPPPYTALPPRTLAEGTEPVQGDLTVPAGSTLVLRLRDTDARPRLTVTPSATASEFEKSDSGYEARLDLTREMHVTARIGARALGDWQFSVTPDQAPTVAFAAEMSTDENKAVVFSYAASDDYGVTNLVARIVPEENLQATPLIVPLASPANAKDVSQSVARDLTSHGYAGTQVQIVLVATDAAEQTGESEPVSYKLPERIFFHPLARAIIEQRKGVAVNDAAGRDRAELAMEALAIGPELFYEDEYGIYLGLRTIKYRLANIRSEDEKDSAISLMWDMAVALDEGELGDALEALRIAQEALADALRRGASDEEIQALMDRLRQAMANYMQQLAENAQPGQMGQMPQGGGMIGEDELEALLRAIEDLARTGNRDEAAQLLAGLMELLQNMQVVQGMGQGQPGEGQEGQPGEEGNSTQEAIQGLGDLMGQQRQLMDRTFRAQQGQGQRGQQGQGQPGQGQPGQGQPGEGQPGQGQPGQGQFGQFDPNGDPGAGGLAQQQQALREQLREIIEGLNADGQQAPEGLGGAGEAMGQAQGDLENNQFASATQSEQAALDQMREGARQLARDMANQTGQNGEAGDGELIEDPLGRNVSGGNPLGRLLDGIPNQSDLQRAREILDELRRRAAELGRSQEELNYIDRLLDLF